MNQVKINLDSDLLTLLSSSNFDKFTVLEFRSAYLALSHQADLNKVEVRRFIYRNILRLEKKGFLKRAYSKKTDKTYYIKTTSFDINNFKKISHDLDEEVINSNEPKLLPKDILQSLINKLQNYKVELLTSIGETDEYKSLCLEYPQLKEQLQESYNFARENSQKIIGKVKALEKSIEQQKLGVQAK